MTIAELIAQAAKEGHLILCHREGVPADIENGFYNPHEALQLLKDNQFQQAYLTRLPPNLKQAVLAPLDDIYRTITYTEAYQPGLMLWIPVLWPCITCGTDTQITSPYCRRCAT